VTTTPTELEKLREYEERLSREITPLLDGDVCTLKSLKLARLARIHSDCLKYIAHLAVTLQPKN
jgi:hypothetical protein